MHFFERRIGPRRDVGINVALQIAVEIEHARAALDAEHRLAAGRRNAAMRRRRAGRLSRYEMSSRSPRSRRSFGEALGDVPLFMSQPAEPVRRLARTVADVDRAIGDRAPPASAAGARGT